MPYQRPTLQEVVDRILSDFASRIDNASTFLRRSVYKVLSRVVGGVAHGLYGYINFIKDQMFISTADAEFLERHGAEYGINKDAGTKATGTVALSGTTGVSISAQTQLQSATGNIYRTDAAATLVGGVISVAITATEYGNDYNEDAGVTLTFLSPILYVNSDATVDSNGLTGGVDPQSNSDYREAILTRKRRPPHGGTKTDYEVWAKEYSGVTRAWAIEQYYGIGTVGLAFVFDDDADSIFPDDAERQAVRDYIESHTDPITGKTVGIPVTADPGFIMIDTEALSVNLTVQIYPNTSAIQAAAITKLTELINQDGGPEISVRLSRLSESISATADEQYHKITSPVADITSTAKQVHVIGDITFEDYT